MRPQPALLLAAALAVSSVACASGGKTSEPRTRPEPVAGQASTGADATSDSSIAHFLDRLTFGARTRDIESVRRLGVERFLDAQMHPERIDDIAMDKRLATFETLGLSAKDVNEQYYLPAQEARRRRQMEMKAVAGNAAASARPATPAPPSPAEQELMRRQRLPLQELSAQKILRAVYSERQFQEVLVDFWFNHFNVFAGKGADRGLLTVYERDAIRPHVFGRFRDMLGAVAASPAMLFYLDNWLSVDPNGPHPVGRGRARPPRYSSMASPLLPQGANARRRGINENYARELLELHTLGVDAGYTQRDIVEVARCFTGWTIAQPRDGGSFKFDERQHDPGQKHVLAHVIKAGGGKDDGDKVLDILSRDPHTAHFIATKLVRRFVSDDPPPALVERVARRFRETDGDLRAVYKAIFLSAEFALPAAHGAKVKTPLEFVASALRTTGASVTDANAVVQAVRTLGMPLYFCQPPTGYPDRADAWMNTGTLVNRLNFAVALAGNRLPGVRIDSAALTSGDEAGATLPALAQQLLAAPLSASTLEVVERATSPAQVLALTLGSPEFQKR